MNRKLLVHGTAKSPINTKVSNQQEQVLSSFIAAQRNGLFGKCCSEYVIKIILISKFE
jgi:hypothetical protein